MVAAPEGALWTFVTDMDNWAPYMVGYRSHRLINEVESFWTLQGDAGLLSRTLELRVQIVEWAEHARVRFTLEGLNEPITGSGTFTMKPAGSVRPLGNVEPEPAKEDWWQKLVRRLFRRWLGVGASRAPGPGLAAGGERTELNFALELRAGGMMGPMLDAIIEPLLMPAAKTLAGKIATEVEARTGSTSVPGPAADDP